MSPPRPKILFFSEAATLAHTVRPLVLAQALDRAAYDIHFASAYRYETLFKDKPFTYWPIESISSAAFLLSVGGGKTAYHTEQLEDYLAEEESLIRQIKPDLIVSDTRLTLAISAPHLGVPLVNLNNAYWSPYRREKSYPLPDYKQSALFHMFPASVSERIMPYGLVKSLYPFTRAIFQNLFMRPFNQARRRRNLAPFGNFEEFYLFGDWTLYLDAPDLIPLENAPANHRFLGPLLWSPPEVPPLPAFDNPGPAAFVSFGSSNGVPQSDAIVRELARMDMNLWVATAGQYELQSSSRVHTAEFLPGLEAAQRSSLVICSGGSTAAYQALSVGTPVLGIPANTDQHLSMGYIERQGAGLSIRSDQATPQSVRRAAERILSEPRFKIQAQALAENFRQYDAPQKFRDFVNEVLPPRPGSTVSDQGLQTLPGLLRARAERSPEAPAFWDVERDLPKTYAQVWAEVQSLAATFQKLGLARGERVGFLAGSEAAWEEAQMAVLLAGGAVVGLDLRDSPEKILKTVQQAGIRAWVLQNNEVLTNSPDVFRDDFRFALVLAGGPPPSGHRPVFSLEELKKDGSRKFEGPWPSPADLATLIFTSGTTSEPKGLAYSHRELIHAVRAIIRAYRQLPEGYRTVSWLPLANLFQRVVNLCGIAQGALIGFVHNPNKLAQALPHIQPEILIGVPRFYEKLEAGIQKAVAGRPWPIRRLFHLALNAGVRQNAWRQRTHPGRFLLWPYWYVLDRLALRPVRAKFGGHMRYLVSGSAPAGPEILRFFSGLGLPILEGYGTSENTVPIAMNRPNAFRLGTVGRPLAPNEVRLSKEGEVLVKGPGVFSGYWKTREDQALFFEGHYRTGDEGQFDEDGFLRLLGRRSDFIKTSTGRRIAPAPIEQVFQELPFVDQAVLMGNGRKGAVLLVTIDLNVLAGHFDRRLDQVQSLSGEGLPPEIENHVAAQLRAKTQKLSPWHQPLGILILNRAFSTLRGEITGNLKVRRRAIEANYTQLLDSLLKTDPAEPPALWFLSAADVRMQEVRQFRSLPRLRAGILTRWWTLSRFFLGASAAYGHYLRRLLKEPQERPLHQRRLLARLGKLFHDRVGPLKGPLMKIGQTLSYVSIDLPTEFRQAMEDLQHVSPPLASKKIRQAIKKELGHWPEDLFAEWSDTPLASASISQIHLARLKDGRRVVVKVRYPKIKKIVKTDLAAVWLALPVIRAVSGVRNVGENFDEARRMLLAECDFRKEAAYMDRFRRLFAGHSRVVIPEVFPEFSSAGVLTMEYLEGQRYAEFKATATQAEKDAAGQAIFEFSTAFAYGIFNADPHPGNYLFSGGKVCFLDFGFCKEWPPEFIFQLKRQTQAAMANDVETFADATRRMGVRVERGRFDYAALMECYITCVYRPWLQKRPFKFTPEWVREQTEVLLRYQVALKGVYSPPEVLAFSRLFWGQHALLADLGATVDCYRITNPLMTIIE